MTFREKILFIKNLSRKKKLILAAVCLLIFFIIAMLVGMVSNSLSGGLFGKTESLGLFGYIGRGLSSGLAITIILFLGMLVLAFFIIGKGRLRNAITDTDERGVNFFKNSTLGSARWSNEEDIRRQFEVGTIDEVVETVFGTLPDQGSQVVAYKKNRSGPSGNRNILIYGSPGTGKSFTYVRTEMLQSIRRGDSLVVTDPSGELYRDCAGYFRQQGVDVKLINFMDPKYSDGWNCVTETIDPETERLSGTRLNSFCEIYITNLSMEGLNDNFWQDGAINLFAAYIGLCAWRREVAILEGLRQGIACIYSSLGRAEKYREKEIDSVLSNEHGNIVEGKNLFREAAREAGLSKGEANEMIAAIENAAPPFTMNEVLYYILTLRDSAAMGVKFASIPLEHPAASSYLNFNDPDVSANVKSSTRQGLSMKLKLLYGDTRLKNLVSTDGIVLSEINRKQTAFFIITQDKEDTLRPIASLFFSFLFKNAEDNWDRESSLAAERGLDRPDLREVNIILDEFYSLGVIKNFATLISTTRKRKLNISIIVQGITQIFQNYGDYDAATILTCCDFVVFLGCNDPETAKYISEFLAGLSTVATQSRSESDMTLFHNRFETLQVSETQRNLMTQDEARRWRGKVFLCKVGEQPSELMPFPFTNHPSAKALIQTSLWSHQTISSDREKNPFSSMTVDKVVNQAADEYSFSGPLAKVMNDLEIRVLSANSDDRAEPVRSRKVFTMDELFGESEPVKVMPEDIQEEKPGPEPGPPKVDLSIPIDVEFRETEAGSVLDDDRHTVRGDGDRAGKKKGRTRNPQGKSRGDTGFTFRD